MSRFYRINVRAKNTSAEEIGDVFEVHFTWEETSPCWADSKGITYFEGTGNLCGGESEKENFERIKKHWKLINPKVRIEISYTCLEDLPQETYGNLEEE